MNVDKFIKRIEGMSNCAAHNYVLNRLDRSERRMDKAERDVAKALISHTGRASASRALQKAALSVQALKVAQSLTKRLPGLR